MKSRLKRELQIAEKIEAELQIAGEVLFSKVGRDAGHLSALRRAGSYKPRIRAGDPGYQKVPKIAGEFARKVLRTTAVALEVVDKSEDRAAILIRQRGSDLRHGIERERTE